MQSTIAAILPAFAMLIPFLFGVLGFKLYLRMEQKRPVRRPFTQDFMRLPGQSLRDRIESVKEEFDTNLLIMILLPVMMFAIHLSQSYFGEASESIVRIGFSVIVVLGIVVYFLRNLIKNRKGLAALRLGLDGEIATAQLLDSLKRHGFFVYHDFQAKGFNIDHVLVGPNGIFAVETKARSKPDRGNNAIDSKVVFDSQRLIFPDYQESASIDQAKRQAKWLSQWIGSAVGENIPVTPLLVIPGWWVEIKTKPIGIMLTNGTNLNFITRMNSNALLSEKQIKQVTHQLEQKCSSFGA
ncbi:MAG: NERD domain-containing protein [Mariprofundus sp.]|nr:NERD domain-containing protein [Mariprofundus sp.]